MGDERASAGGGKAAPHHPTVVTAQRETITNVGPEPDSQQGGSLLLIVMTGHDVGQIHPLPPSRVITILGRDDDADIQVLDAEISRRHAAIRYDAGCDRHYIADLGSRNGTLLDGERLEGEQPLGVGSKIRLGSATLLRASLSSEPEAKYAKQMYQVALRDGLTGAFNRRYLDERLSSEMAFAKRHGVPLTLLMLDLDHFKRINDTHGHQAGDMVLQRFCALLDKGVRTEDMVARYGGEEFAVLCRDTTEVSATVVAERLRAMAEACELTHEGKRIAVTVSIGIAGAVEHGIEEPAALIRCADQALYRAKQDGRNCWRMLPRSED